MKKTYENAEIEFISVDDGNDVITTSGPKDGGSIGGGDALDNGGWT